MIAKRLYDAVAFFIQVFIDPFPVANLRPCRTFDRKIKTGRVSSFKRRLRRTPGMKTQVIQPIRPGDPEDPRPRSKIRRRIARQWENGAFQRSPQEDPAPIYNKDLTISLKATHSEYHLTPVAITKPNIQRIQIRMVLIPKQRVIPH